MIKWNLSRDARILQYTQISVIHHMNKMKNQIHMIISVDTPKKLLTKFNTSFFFYKNSPESEHRGSKFSLLFSHPVMSDSLQPRVLHHTRPLCLSPSVKVCPSSWPFHQCHPAIASSDTLSSFCSHLSPHQELFQ